jgi:putative methyltransferase (TIGR04325 family)
VYDEEDLEAWDLADPFATPGWISHCRAYAESIRTPPRRSWLRAIARRYLGRTDTPRHLRSPQAIARRLIRERGAVRILDVGGGAGDNFILLTRSLPDAIARRIDHVVVDNAPSIALGRAIFAGRDVRPRFSMSIPAEKFDLVLAISTLQYVREWRGMCAALRASSSEHVYVARSPLTLGTPTFFTVQSVCPAMGEMAHRQVGLAPVVVINKAELDAAMRQDGWKLSHEALLTDLSAHFARLSEPYRRGIAYVDMCWSVPG